MMSLLHHKEICLSDYISKDACPIIGKCDYVADI